MKDALKKLLIENGMPETATDEEAEQYMKDNNIVVAGASELLDCKNSIIVTEDDGHLIAAIGLENMVVAHSPDATLVCHVNQAHRLKELLVLIQQNSGEKFL